MKIEKKKINELQDWYSIVLVDLLNSRNPCFMNLSDLSRLMQWKLMNGKFRINLQKLIDSNDDKQVIAITTNAFRILKEEQEELSVSLSLKELCKLKGVGPATASAILAAKSVNIPFMSDEAFYSIFKRNPKYTMKELLNYIKEIENLVQKWNCQNPNEWSCKKVEEFLRTGK